MTTAQSIKIYKTNTNKNVILDMHNYIFCTSLLFLNITYNLAFYYILRIMLLRKQYSVLLISKF